MDGLVVQTRWRKRANLACCDHPICIPVIVAAVCSIFACASDNKACANHCKALFCWNSRTMCVARQRVVEQQATHRAGGPSVHATMAAFSPRLSAFFLAESLSEEFATREWRTQQWVDQQRSLWPRDASPSGLDAAQPDTLRAAAAFNMGFPAASTTAPGDLPQPEARGFSTKDVVATATGATFPLAPDRCPAAPDRRRARQQLDHCGVSHPVQAMPAEEDPGNDSLGSLDDIYADEGSPASTPRNTRENPLGEGDHTHRLRLTSPVSPCVFYSKTSRTAHLEIRRRIRNSLQQLDQNAAQRRHELLQSQRRRSARVMAIGKKRQSSSQRRRKRTMTCAKT